MPISKVDILKHILLHEVDRMEPEISTFEDDPMQFILRKYPGLNETLTYLMTPSFQDYLTGVYIMAPKPTTFKIVLHNGQFFFLQFTGKTYQATVAGKNYYLMSIGEKERCMLAIARLLRFGSPLKTKGPEGAEQGTRDEEGGGSETTGGETGGGEEAAPEAGAEEEPIAEAKILEEILKKSLIEIEEEVDEDGDDSGDKTYEIKATQALNSQIQEIIEKLPEGKKFITVNINGESYKGITGAERIKGTPKADIALKKGESRVIFISHKKEGDATAFARWGSFQYLFNSGDDEVKTFKSNIYNYIIKNQPANAAIDKNDKIIFYNTAAFSQKIESNLLKYKLVFGKDYKEKSDYSEQNVHVVVQGNIVLKPVDKLNNTYEIDKEAASIVFFSGELPTENYEPVLHVHYRGKGNHNELNITNCETMARTFAAASGQGHMFKAGEIVDPENPYEEKDRITIPKGEYIRFENNEIAVTEDFYSSIIDKGDRKKPKKDYSLYFEPLDKDTAIRKPRLGLSSRGSKFPDKIYSYKIKPNYKKYFSLEK